MESKEEEEIIKIEYLFALTSKNIEL